MGFFFFFFFNIFMQMGKNLHIHVKRNEKFELVIFILCALNKLNYFLITFYEF